MIATGEPTTLTAGSSWQWDVTYSDYPPSDGWALTYVFRGPEDYTTQDGETDADGDTYQVRIPKANTDLTAGAYRLVGYVDDGIDRFVVYDAPLTVLANPTTAVNAASHDEEMLALIDAAIESRLTGSTGVRSFTVNGRAVEYWSLEELLKLQSVYRSRVARQRRGGQLESWTVRFGAPA